MKCSCDSWKHKTLLWQIVNSAPCYFSFRQRVEHMNTTLKPALKISTSSPKPSLGEHNDWKNGENSLTEMWKKSAYQHLCKLKTEQYCVVFMARVCAKPFPGGAQYLSWVIAGGSQPRDSRAHNPHKSNISHFNTLFCGQMKQIWSNC